jgi:hypothetical protein
MDRKDEDKEKRYACKCCGREKSVVYDEFLFTWVCPWCGVIDRERNRSEYRNSDQ